MRRRSLFRAIGAAVGGAGILGSPVTGSGRATPFREVARWTPMHYDDKWAEVPPQLRMIHDVYVQDDYAYLAYWDAGVWILDVSDPTAPAYVTRTGDYTYDELVGFRSDAAEKSAEAPGNAHYVTVTDDATVLGVGAEGWNDPTTDVRGPGGIDLYDSSNRSRPLRRSTIDPPRADDETHDGTWVTAHNFDLHGDRLYSSWYHGGVKVHDVSTPSTPELLAWWRKPQRTIFWTAQVAEPGEFFVASSIDHGVSPGALYTFPDRAGQQADPPTLSESADNETPDGGGAYAPLGRVQVDGTFEAVVGEDGETAYLATRDGFATVDVSDPTDPTVLAERRDLAAERLGGPLGTIFDVAVDGDRLLVPGPAQNGGLSGFLVFDVSDPADPTQVGSFYETSFPIHNAYLADGYAYLTAINGRDNPLVIVDVSDPGRRTTTTTAGTTTPPSTTATTPTTATPSTATTTAQPTTHSPSTTPATTAAATNGGGDGGDTGTGGDAIGQPGFGGLAALLGLGLGAWHYRRRRRE